MLISLPSLKSKRQLDFSRLIELALGTRILLLKLKKQKSSGLRTPSPKKRKTTPLHTTNCISTRASGRTEFKATLIQWNEKHLQII